MTPSLRFTVLPALLAGTTAFAQAPADTRTPIRTFRADSFWVQRWSRGGETEDELLIEPRGIAVARGTVTVLDLGTREVLAMHASTGKSLFTMQARGAGPGEFKRPALLLRAADQFGVLDHETARLSMFTARGALAWDAPVENAFDVEAGCVLPGARVLLKSGGFEKSLVLADSAGNVLGRYSLRRTDPAVVPPPFIESAHMSGPINGDRCAIVPIFGASWYAIDARGAVTAHRYIEPGDAPVVRVSTTVLEKDGRDEIRRATQTTNAIPIARGALHRGDTLIVLGGTSRGEAGRVLDYYVLPSGRYVYSRRLPLSYTSLTVAPDGMFYGTFIGPDWSMVTAFEPSRRAPPRKKVALPH